jgi:hypothetical protein
MDGITVLIVLSLVLSLIWHEYDSGCKILDAFSVVRSEYGILVEKEYTPPQSKIVTKRIVRNHGDFSGTSYDILEEIEVPEKCVLHINLKGRIIVTSVTSKLYDSVNQGDRIFVRYSQERFSKNIYPKEVKHS